MDIINFYETSAVKKLKQQYDDKQYEKTGIHIDGRVLVCGQTGSGKSNSLLQFLQLSDDTFSHIYICHKVDETFYDLLKDKLKGDVTFYRNVVDFPECREFDQQKGVKNPFKYLCVLDDCINDTSKKDLDKIKGYFTYGRKCHVTMLFLAQSYFQTNSFIRKQLSEVILFGGFGSRDLNLILRDHCSSNVSKEDLEKMYRYSTKKPLNFFKITTGNCPKGRKFSHNFIDWFEENDDDEDEMDVV